MKKRSKYLVLFLGGLFIFYGCQRNELEPISKSTEIPAKVTDVEAKALPGGVFISYSIPKSSNILYVIATSTLKDGSIRQAKASYYNHNLTLAGFPDTSKYEIKLYAVSRSEVKSSPVIIQIRPLPSSVLSVAKSLKLKATYGGISIAFNDNTNEENIVIAALAENDGGELKFAKNYYTNAVTDTFYLRGFNTDQRKFAVYVKDTRDNHSDTVSGMFTPYYETEFDKTKFEEVHLPGDTWQAYKSWGAVKAIWDGIIAQGENMYASLLVGAPQSFTFDMGVKANLSRFIYYPIASGNFAYGLVARHFQIWGSNDPDPDGSWDSWTLLRDCEMIKPSGSPTGVVAGVDLEYSQNGIEFIFSSDTPPVRYIRFKALSIWNGESIFIRELTFYGNTN